VLDARPGGCRRALVTLVFDVWHHHRCHDHGSVPISVPIPVPIPVPVPPHLCPLSVIRGADLGRAGRFGAGACHAEGGRRPASTLDDAIAIAITNNRDINVSSHRGAGVTNQGALDGTATSDPISTLRAEYGYDPTHLEKVTASRGFAILKGIR
jgi:hypothetical protein